MPELRRYFASHKLASAVLLSILFAMLVLRAMHMPFEVPRADQSQYLAYAYNLLHHGTFSTGASRTPEPDQRREPGYPLLLAAGMALHPGLHTEESTKRCIVRGRPPCLAAVTGLKLINLLFLGLSGITVFAAVLAVTHQPVAAWLGFLWLMASATYGSYVGRFFPEVIVGFLVVALSLYLWRLATDPPRRRSWFLAGLLLGALVLIKATYYYLAPLLALALAAQARFQQKTPLREALLLGTLFLAGTLALTLPWQLRNAISTGTTAISGRAGLVLTVRANFDELPAGGLLGAASTFTPSGTSLQRFLEERWLTPEVAAMLEPPNDPKTRGYQRQRELAKPNGLTAYDAELDRMLKTEALERIKVNWRGHLRVTPLMGYRGMFVDRGIGIIPARVDPEVGTRRTLFDNAPAWFLPAPLLQNFLLFLPAFAAFGFCLLTGRWPLVFLMVPAAYLFALQALMTHYIGRYSVALIPALVVISTVSATASWAWITASVRRSRIRLRQRSGAYP